MSRLIDADAIRYEPMLSARGNGQYVDVMVAYKDQIDDMPIIEERKTGKWIGVTPMVDTLMCSECEYNIINKEFKTPYCPNCGAKMEVERDGI